MIQEKKSITKNYMYNLIYQVLVLISPLITIPYISRVLGAENIGIYSYTLSITAYFILFGALGMSLYAQREIAYNQDSPPKYSLIFWEMVLLRIITMSISILIYYFTIIKYGTYQLYYKILILEILGNCIDITWFFQGLEEFKKIVKRNVIIKLISITCTFALVKTSNDLVIYFIIYVLTLLIGNLSLWIYLPKFLVRIDIRKINVLRHLKQTSSLFVPQLAVQVYTILDKTMVGTIVQEKAEVGYYDQSQKIIKIALSVVTSLGTVMLPRIANNYIKNEKEAVRVYMEKSFNLIFLLSFPMMFGVLAVSGRFVPVFFGQGYDRVIILMNIISPIFILIALSNVIGAQYLLPTKRQKEYTISVVSGAILNFVANMCLIWKLKAVGASIGTVIAEIAVTSVQLYFVRKDFKIKDLIKMSKNYIISSVIMFGVCCVTGMIIKDNLIATVLEVLIGIITYFACLIILKEEFIGEILDKLNIQRNF